MQKVLHGDRVMARISGVDRRGRPEGKIVEVLERAQRRSSAGCGASTACSSSCPRTSASRATS